MFKVGQVFKYTKEDSYISMFKSINEEFPITSVLVVDDGIAVLSGDMEINYQDVARGVIEFVQVVDSGDVSECKELLATAICPDCGGDGELIPIYEHGVSDEPCMWCIVREELVIGGTCEV